MNEIEQRMLELADRLYTMGSDESPMWRDGLRFAAEQIRFSLGWHLDGRSRIESAPK